MRRSNVTLLIWLGIIGIIMMFGNYFFINRDQIKNISYTYFVKEVEKGNVVEVTMTEDVIEGRLKNPITEGDKTYYKFKTRMPIPDSDIVHKMIEKDVKIEVKPATHWWDIILPYLPFVLLIVVWIFFMKQLQSGPNKAFTFIKARAKEVKVPDVTFKDVAGVDEAKEELMEVVDFLKRPSHYRRLGGRIPRGVLLLGAPGTGKTLMARAVAGEAGVPFFTISGSDFVEMFVGVGAARVRDLFERAKANAPSIVFIDEIDAVGRYRGAGIGGGHDEREQTLNALLVEMDGFDNKTNVIVMAATNRPDILDPALLRPGRFDRQIMIDRPDIKGRYEILKIHTRKVPLAPEVDLEEIARGTPGFTGADLANLVNEASLLAARHNHIMVEPSDFEEARDKVLMGLARKSKVISEEEKKIIAYHESGHAILTYLSPHADPLHKVTIIPRGQALGVTQQLPEEDRHLQNKSYLEDMLVILMGGRAAENIIFEGDVTTGAANDLTRATEIARKMVCEWGMSDKIGPVVFSAREENVFLGKNISKIKEYSEETAKLLDEEIDRIVKESYEKALNTLKDHRDALDRLAEALLDRETLTGDEVEQIIKGEENGREEDNGRSETDT